jgi:hypothetical protein
MPSEVAYDRRHSAQKYLLPAQVAPSQPRPNDQVSRDAMRSTGPASSHSHQRRGRVAAGRHQHVHYVMLRVTVSTREFTSAHIGSTIWQRQNYLPPMRNTAEFDDHFDDLFCPVR